MNEHESSLTNAELKRISAEVSHVEFNMMSNAQKGHGSGDFVLKQHEHCEAEAQLSSSCHCLGFGKSLLDRVPTERAVLLGIRGRLICELLGEYTEHRALFKSHDTQHSDN